MAPFFPDGTRAAWARASFPAMTNNTKQHTAPIDPWPDAPATLDVRQIAELTGRGQRTIRRWIADGELPAYRLSGSVVVMKSDLVGMLTPVRAAK